MSPVPAPGLLWPALAMVALTFAVWVRMYVVRFAAMRRERIRPQDVATSAMAASRLLDTRASDNFRNLFELPVLFYVALLAATLLHLADGTILALAWTYVALRVLHSVLHCGPNLVVPRFAAHAASSLVLWAIWGVIALRLFA